MDLKSVLAVVGLVWRRGVTPPPGHVLPTVIPAGTPVAPSSE